MRTLVAVTGAALAGFEGGGGGIMDLRRAAAVGAAVCGAAAAGITDLRRDGAGAAAGGAGCMDFLLVDMPLASGFRTLRDTSVMISGPLCFECTLFFLHRPPANG